MSKTVTVVMMLFIVFCVSGVVMAEDAKSTTKPAGETVTDGSDAEQHIYGSITILAGCFGAAGCAIGGGLAIARLGSTCIESMARQPEAAGSMFLPMIIAAGMIEGSILFAILVCMMATQQ